MTGVKKQNTIPSNEKKEETPIKVRTFSKDEIKRIVDFTIDQNPLLFHRLSQL